MLWTYDSTRIPLGRRDCMAYALTVREGGRELVYLCTLHAGTTIPTISKPPRGGKLMPVRLYRGGRELSYTVTARYDGMTLDYEGGKAQICVQKDDILRLRAENADLVLMPELDVHEVAKDRNDGSWEIAMFTPKMLVVPVIGDMQVEFSFDVHTSVPGKTCFTFTGKDGVTEAAVHIYLSNGLRPERYPAFDEVQRELRGEFAAFLDKMPVLPAAYEGWRELGAYLVWEHIMQVQGNELIYMNKGIHRSAFSWQQSHQAIGQYRNAELAWKLIASMFDYQDDFGMLPDAVDDMKMNFSGTKPPIQGVALMFLFRYTDFGFVPKKEYRRVYDGLSRLVYWWMSFRDTDNSGIPKYDAADESGWDDSSMFRKGMPVGTPDLSTYMILAMDALAVMAHRLQSRYEENEWKRRSAELTALMLKHFRVGNRLLPKMNGTGEVVECGSATLFIPLLLGDRLPPEIIDTLISDLTREGDWLCPYGLAGEKLGSPDYREGGWISGPVLAPAQLLVCLGLLSCGRTAEAHLITKRYTDALMRSGFSMVMNPKTGADSSEFRWGERYPNRMSWTGMVFLVLGSLFLTADDVPAKPAPSAEA